MDVHGQKWSWVESNPAFVGVAKVLVTTFSRRQILPVGVTAGATALDVYRGDADMEATDGSGRRRTTVDGAAKEGSSGLCPWTSTDVRSRVERGCVAADLASTKFVALPPGWPYSGRTGGRHVDNAAAQ